MIKHSYFSPRRSFTVLLLTLLSQVLLPGAARAGRTEPENQPDPRTRSFPHIDWCVNYEGGTPRVLFIVTEQSAWEVYALALRMDLQFDVFYTEKPWGFAPKTDYFHEGIRLFPQAVADLKALLAKSWDVIAFVDFAPNYLPPQLHYQVIKAGINGTGLVTFNCPRWQTNLRYKGIKEEKNTDFYYSFLPKSAFTFPARKRKEKVNIDMRGNVMLDSYRWVAEPYELQPLVIRHPGKGIVVDFVPGGGNYFGGPAICPAKHQDPEELLQSEYFYGLAAKIIHLANGTAPTLMMSMQDLDGKVVEPGKPIHAKASVNKAFAGKLRLLVRTHRNVIVHEKVDSIEIQENAKLPFTIPPLPAGAYYVDAWLLKLGKTVDWASAHIIVRSPVQQITTLTLEKKSLVRTETVRAQVTVKPAGPGMHLAAGIVDANGRVLARKKRIRLRKGRAEVAIPLTRTREIYHTLVVDLVANNLVVDTRKVKVFAHQPLDGDLVVFAEGDDKNLLGQRRLAIYREFGVTFGQLGADQGGGYPFQAVAAGLFPAYRIWLTHCHPYTGGCISARSYPDAIAETFRRTVETLRPYGLAFLSIGDDSGTGRDFCHSYPAWVRSFIVKMAEKYNGDFNAFIKARGMKRRWGAFRYMAWNAKLADILSIKLLPGELELLKQCWRENYRSIAEFNRASGTSFTSFQAITEADLKEIKYVDPCVLGFRDAMKAKYGDVSALNAAWNAQLNSFEAIEPSLMHDLFKQGKYGASLDKTCLVAGLRLAFPDLDKRRVMVQTPDGLLVLDKGKIKQVRYRALATTDLAAARCALDRLRNLVPKVTNTYYKRMLSSLEESFKKSESTLKAPGKLSRGEVARTRKQLVELKAKLDGLYWRAMQDVLLASLPERPGAKKR